MNKLVKRLWIKALLSGKFKQGKGALRKKNNTYCCLGVLCELYILERKRKWMPSGSVYMLEGRSAVLPPVVQHWSGVDASGCYCDKGLRTLASDNDNGSSFRKIAATIKKYF